MEYGWKEVLGVITACLVSIGAGVPAFNYISNLVAERRKNKFEADKQRFSEKVELRRLENESDDAEFKRMVEMLRLSDEDNKKLREELKLCNESSSLSGVTINKLYRNMNNHEQKLIHLDWLIQRDEKFQSLVNPMAILKESFEEMRKGLPQ